MMIIFSFLRDFFSAKKEEKTQNCIEINASIEDKRKIFSAKVINLSRQGPQVRAPRLGPPDYGHRARASMLGHPG